MEPETSIILFSVFGGVIAVLIVVAVVLFTQVTSLRRRLTEMQATGRIRVQKLRIDDNDKNHAFHNPGLTPDEELSKRGFSMYSSAADDVESGRNPERQTGGLADNLAREIENRNKRQSNALHLKDTERHQRQPHHSQEIHSHQQRHNPLYHQEIESQQNKQSAAPPFLLQSIQENKKKMALSNPMSNGRQSDTNPNFMY